MVNSENPSRNHRGKSPEEGELGDPEKPAVTDKPHDHPNPDTEVHLKKRGAPGKWGGPRISRSMKIDDNIWKAFRERTKELSTSVCSEVETFMIAYLGATEHMAKNKVHLGTTINLEQTVFRQLGRDRRKVRRTLEEVHAEKAAVRGMEEGLVSEMAQKVFEQFVVEGHSTDRMAPVFDIMREQGIPEERHTEVKQVVIDLIITWRDGRSEMHSEGGDP